MISIKCETMKNGVQRPYADRVYEYRITASGLSKEQVLDFCRSIVKPCLHSIINRPNLFDSYYTFYSADESGVYIYRVTEPFSD